MDFPSGQPPYQPHKLVVPVLFTGLTELDDLDGMVVEMFGRFDSRTAPIPFTFTTYYDEEMESPIHRVIYSISELVNPDHLGEYKRTSIGVERNTARADGRRLINFDPGLLSLSRLILATTKASGHRIPIGNRLWAEITLLFRHGRYEPLEWTYPDFRGDAYREWLLEVRSGYHSQLKALDPETHWRL